MSRRTCSDCGATFDDVDHRAICPHEPFPMRTQVLGYVDGEPTTRWALCLDDLRAIEHAFALGEVPAAGVDDLGLVHHDRTGRLQLALAGAGQLGALELAAVAADTIAEYDADLFTVGALMAGVLGR